MSNVTAMALSNFPKNLKKLRQDRGWSQSDLAREIWGTTKDGRGYDVARNRDRISVYEKGTSVPTEDHLREIATVLGVSPQELAPDVVAHRAEKRRDPAMAMVMVPGEEGDPQIVHFRTNLFVSLDTAAKVIALLQADPNTKEFIVPASAQLKSA